MDGGVDVVYPVSFEIWIEELGSPKPDNCP